MDHPIDVLLVRGGLVVRAVRPEELTWLLAALDAAEADAGAPLVDEVERERLGHAAEGGRWPAGWLPIGAFRGPTPVGYAGVTTAPSGAEARGDAAVFHLDPAWAVLSAVLAGARLGATDAGARGLEIWVRLGGDREVDVAEAEGYRVARRLGVLGRHLDELPGAVTAPGYVVRSYVPDADDGAVVEVLAGAYAETPEAGWDRARFAERRALPWFRAEDLLLAVDEGGAVDGLHWLKRRDAMTGEVYNLAIHPRAQGRRLGPALLSAGLHHLRSVGCAEVMLWVDRANERAVQLYTAQGFETRWDDLAFRVTLP